MAENYSLESFKAAHERILKAGVIESPVKRSSWLSNLIEGNVYLKLDFFQESCTSKIRGAINHILKFKELHNALPKQVVTACGGNHSIAVAIACHKFKIPSTIYLPCTLYSEEKRAILEDVFGAKVIMEGETFKESNQLAIEAAQKEGLCFIHQIEDPWMIQGEGTIYLEIEKQINSFDSIVAPIGGGGLMSGLIEAARSSNNDRVQFYSVEPKGADYYYQSHTEGKLITLHDVCSIAHPLAAVTSNDEFFQRFEKNIAKPLIVDDCDAIETIFQLLDREKILVEPSSACAVTALVKNQSLFKGKNVVLIMGGANVSIEECLERKRQYFPLEY